jgi:hypothetical protein
MLTKSKDRKRKVKKILLILFKNNGNAIRKCIWRFFREIRIFLVTHTSLCQQQIFFFVVSSHYK